jgi:diguanylate cyclase (GGDEF)-like protein/PAS domain S-box-containing protein
LFLASVAAQLVRRRPPSKAVFNVGQTSAAAAAGIAVSHSLSSPGGSLQSPDVAAAVLGALAFFLVNSAAVTAVLVSLGATWRSCVLDGLRLRLGLSSAGVIVGALLAVAVQTETWALVLAAPGLMLLRHTISAQFRAEHDRARVEGLFEATMDTNRTLNRDAVMEAVLRSARKLLRSPDTHISHLEPDSELSAPINANGGRMWLVAAGRRREEPFEDTDRSLLDALAAVASGAATNAELFRQVRYERQRLASIALSTGEGVVAVDLDGRLTFANLAAADMVGLPSVAKVVDDQNDPDAMRAPEWILAAARRCIDRRELVRDDNATFPARAGGTIPVAYSASPILDAGGAVGAVIAFRDMTERKTLEDELRHQAGHDTLTGLGNRRLLVDRLDRALTSPTLRDKTHAVVFIDVDRFKGVNDSLGHAIGDDLLVAVADRLRQATGDGDVLARFGGDEFVVLLEDVEGAVEATAAARRMCAAVEQPIVLADGYELVASVSAGVALSAPGTSADDLLHDADVAMYDTKTRRHGGSVQLFDHASMSHRSAVRVQLEADLRKAVDRGEIEVYYQPRFALHDLEIVGAEALVRWRHPQLGLLQPAAFIALAEETGLIVPVGRCVLEQAADEVRGIEDSLGVSMPISVNLSPRQFNHTGLVTDIRRAIRDARIDPSCITVEITESMVMDDLAGARALMTELCTAGIKIAVDDFGTGHSSLGYLKQFPVQELKIDRSFVAGVAEHPIDRAIARAVIQLAEAMNVLPVAEGIETAEQLNTLLQLGCSLGQGYYFAKPLPPDELHRLLRRQHPGTDLRGQATAVATVSR